MIPCSFCGRGNAAPAWKQMKKETSIRNACEPQNENLRVVCVRQPIKISQPQETEERIVMKGQVEFKECITMKRTKKVIALLIMVCMLIFPLAVSVSAVSSSNFTDINNHWARVYIQYMVDVKHVMNGTSDTTFSPNRQMTRGEFVTVLGRVWGVKESYYDNNFHLQFSDVSSSSFYAPFARWAAANNIVPPITSTTFGPNKLITREEMAVFIQNFFGAILITPKTNGAYSGFSDYSSITPSRRSAVIAMCRAGILACPAGGTAKFRPKDNFTRSEFCSVLYNFYLKYFDKNAYGANSVTVSVVEATSFRTKYGTSADAYIRGIMNHANEPYQNRWNVIFQPAYIQPGKVLPEDSCQNGYWTPCNIQNGCGVHTFHCKNITRNLNFAKSDTKMRNGKDMIIVASSADLCSGDSCSVGSYGLSTLGQHATVVRMLKNRTDTCSSDVGNTRLIQHELSHCFKVLSDNGGDKNNCTPGALCIMTSGYDYNRTYDLPNIWCPACQRQFIRTQH